jgi:hypothetical protein
VRGYVAVATPFGGAITSVNGRIAGRGADLSGNETTDERPENGERRSDLMTSLAYKFTFGMPSVVMMLPYPQALGGNWVSLTAEGPVDDCLQTPARMTK